MAGTKFVGDIMEVLMSPSLDHHMGKVTVV